MSSPNPPLETCIAPDPGGEGARAPAALARGVGRLTPARLRLLAQVRRRLAPLVLLAPLLLVLAVDLAIRGERLADLRGKHVASYVAAAVESGLVWGLLLYVASARRGLLRWVAAATFVALATLAVGGQLYFYRQYSTYLNLDATLFGTSFAESLFAQLRADGRNFLASVAPPFALAVSLVVVARRLLRPRDGRSARLARLAAPAAVAAAFLVPCSYRTVQASTPDVIYFHAVGGLVQQLTGVSAKTAQVRPGLRAPPALPPLSARTPAPPGAPAAQRNVLFVLTESVRADVGCAAPSPRCPTMPQTNAAVSARMPLTQMRSSSSTTAIQLAVLWSGLEPTASREALHEAPLLFEYAAAAGRETAYWTSHHMMFANSRLFVQDLPTRFQCGATDLDPLADIDMGADDGLLTKRVERELPELREPFFAVVHYGNTHVPYLVDPLDAPFQPSLENKGPEANEAYRNLYKNAVHRQDKAIGKLLRFVRGASFGPRTVIVFTSDHGEAFREHGQLGHTASVLDEEIHVPAWVDAPPGTLDEAELAALAAVRDRPVFHTDVAPTVLDLMGLLDEPALGSYRSAMVGESLLRPMRPPRVVALSNCSGVWSCAFRNYGVMRGPLKLEAREWDRSFHCYDVLVDPGEQRDLGPAACGDLAQHAERLFGGLPGASE